MAHAAHHAARLCLAFVGATLFPLHCAAQANEAFETSARNLLVVLRESHGENKQDELLQPFGKLRATMADGREIELETSWYRYPGDMHIRLVFDGAQALQSTSPEDLSRLRLSPDEALKVAVATLRRRYGTSAVFTWSGGLMQVQGTAPDLTSSYFLDREFWQGLQHRYPEGLVVAAWFMRQHRMTTPSTACDSAQPPFAPEARARACHRRCTCSRMITGRYSSRPRPDKPAGGRVVRQ